MSRPWGLRIDVNKGRVFVMSIAATKKYRVGQDNVTFLGLDLHNPVFFISGVVIVSFVILTLLFQAGAKEFFRLAAAMADDPVRLGLHDCRELLCSVLSVPSGFPVGKRPNWWR